MSLMKIFYCVLILIKILLLLFRWKTQLQELTKLPPFAKVSAADRSCLHREFK